MKDKLLGANLAPSLREQYHRRSVRVIKGDTVKVLRGEYSGIEGKIERVNTNKGTLSIEGVQREKIRGGNVKVPIHSSNVQIVAMKLDDRYRMNNMQAENKSNGKTGKIKPIENSYKASDASEKKDELSAAGTKSKIKRKKSIKGRTV